MNLAGLPVLVADLQFPEGLRWHDGRLWFSDMHAGAVHAADPTGDDEVVVRIEGDMPSGLGFLPDGSLLIVSMRRRRLLRMALDGRVAVHADLSQFPGNYLNDMAVSRAGYAYVGSRVVRPMSFKDLSGVSLAGADTLLRVDQDGRVEGADAAAVSPNGCVVTPDGSRLIMAETRAHRLGAYDVDSQGRLSNHQVLAEIDPLIPDGICLDADGAVWVGSGVSGVFARIRPGGEVTDRITLPDGLWATCCELGGPDGRTLFLAVCRADLPQVSRLVHGESAESSSAQGWIATTTVMVPRV
jgi:sugar lactone lactonase YvrE